VTLRVTCLAGDTDGDTISDWYEWEHYDSRTACSPFEDDDGDGAWNVEEFAAHTDPWDGTSVLEFTAIRVLGSGLVEIKWKSEEAVVYGVDRSEGLRDGWDPIAPSLDGMPPLNTYTDTAPAGLHPWYRISIAP
jgi:hypothetical protein